MRLLACAAWLCYRSNGDHITIVASPHRSWSKDLLLCDKIIAQLGNGTLDRESENETGPHGTATWEAPCTHIRIQHRLALSVFPLCPITGWRIPSSRAIADEASGQRTRGPGGNKAWVVRNLRLRVSDLLFYHLVLSLFCVLGQCLGHFEHMKSQ